MSGREIRRLAHAHLLVPDRYDAARWYRENMGYEICEEYEMLAWMRGGPLHISADGGRSTVVLFERASRSEFRTEMSVDLQVDGERFVRFARGLEVGFIRDGVGNVLTADAVVDHDVYFAYSLDDPYDNQVELACYDYEYVKRDLIDAGKITPRRRK